MLWECVIMNFITMQLFFDKHPEGTLFSAEGIFRLYSVDALPIQGIYGRHKKDRQEDHLPLRVRI